LILVIEDEYLLMTEVDRALTDGGFATDMVSSGEEALALFMGGDRSYNALVTGVNLGPGLNGWEVANRIREKEPVFPVIYTTAYAEDWASHGVPNSVLVPKPFAQSQLVTTLSNPLNIRT